MDEELKKWLETDKWWERAFDGNYGIRSQRAVMEYVRLVNEYNRAVKQGPVNARALQKWREDIQSARDAVEKQQRGPRESFEEPFHHLDRISTAALKEGLRRYELYWDELPESIFEPQFVEHRTEVPSLDTDAYGRFLFTYKPVEPPLTQQRRFLESAIYEIKAALDSRQESQPKASRAEEIAEEISRKIEAEAKLRKQWEEDVRKYPDQEEMIRRTYRRAIDALREME